uniref:Uncharacterized protein n=1 Tax=Panagrellus redivivus TaxID=6233 RepID=A0A7E4ZZE6_PANRE
MCQLKPDKQYPSIALPNLIQSIQARSKPAKADGHRRQSVPKLALCTNHGPLYPSGAIATMPMPTSRGDLRGFWELWCFLEAIIVHNCVETGQGIL